MTQRARPVTKTRPPPGRRRRRARVSEVQWHHDGPLAARRHLEFRRPNPAAAGPDLGPARPGSGSESETRDTGAGESAGIRVI